MSKAKELLKELNKVFKISELEAALGASNFDEAINDDLINKVKETAGTEWLTVEAAKNNPALKDHFKEVWHPVHLKSFFAENEKRIDDEFADFDDIKEGLTGKKINEKIKFLKEQVKAAKEKGSTEEVDKLKKTLTDYKKQVSEFETAKQKEIEAVNKTAEDKINGYKTNLIKGKFEQLALSKDWADAYKIDDVRKPILESKFNEVQSKALIDLDDAGNIVLKDKNNPELELFEGSKKVTFDSLVDAQIAPFIKKSGGSGNQNQNGGGGQQLKSTDDGLDWRAKQMLRVRERNGQTA